MSSEPPSDVRSAASEVAAAEGADDADSDFTLASLVHMRGASLIDALDRHAPGSREHAEATASYAFVASVELDHDRSHSELVREAAKLHDVGTVHVPAAVLAKPAPERTPEERAQIDGHHVAGYKLARGAGVPEQVCGWILRARERFDGQGPDGLAGEAIAIESRIIRAACACERALADPGLAPARDAGERRRRAIEALRGQAGPQLDPRVVDALAAALDRAS